MLTRRSVLAAAATMVTPATPIVVSPQPFPTLRYGELVAPCVVGRGGIRGDKHEGDGATPAGRYPLRRLLFRQDRIPTVASRLPIAPIRTTDAWSDDPADPDYNRQIALPRPRHHEALWRSDHLYDIVIVIGYNDAPAIPGKGSAVFLHIASPGMTATDGCVAIPLGALVKLAGLCGTATSIDIRS